jgi:glycosyltransferase involved in cell wall biosynthesis
LLQSVNPENFGFSRVIVWSKKTTLDQIFERPWLQKVHLDIFEKSIIYRMLWQRFELSRIARKSGCDILFVPGGSFSNSFSPVVTMSRNLLPFELKEIFRYKWTLFTLKLFLLRFSQSRSFVKANGLIFLTKYAQNSVSKVVRNGFKKVSIIPHGINQRFLGALRLQKAISKYTSEHPFRILYVSIIDVYKHQWHVAEAVAKLYEAGIPVELILVGPSVPMALERLQQTLKRIDPYENCVRYVGPIPHEKLHEQYAHADMCLFASSCENMPNILLEKMASGLPLVCSNKGPMPEVLGDAGEYFDPENSEEIADVLLKMIESPKLRQELAERSFKRVQEYSWERCANETFRFLRDVALEHKNLK